MAALTNREIISDIVNDLRALNLDDRVSKRYILSKLRSFAALFIKRDADTRRLLNIAEIWTNVPCVELCEKPLVDCCDIDIPNCDTVMVSRKKLPEVLQTQYKELLQIINPKYSREFIPTTPQQYKNIINREFQDKRLKYYWISNGYLVVPDALVTTVTVRGVFLEPSEAMKLNSCIPAEEQECISILDQPFICPDYLVSVVKQETLKDLFSFYKRNIVDEAPNLNTNEKVSEKVPNR
jgi:hypothetical protein